jgi:tRNA(Ile2) C34 agmatinyltransferase TiaS
LVQDRPFVDPSNLRGGRTRVLLFSSYMNKVEDQAPVCPHCKKPFDAELLAEGSRHEGFKCPHCRLFVPAERANGADGTSS